MPASASATRFEVAARVLSLIGLPPVLALPTALLAGARAGGTFAGDVSVVCFLCTGCLVPTALTVWLLRRGRVSALDLRERSDTLLPSGVTVVG
ncbi:MAG: hypothetical protein JO318_15265, partial [Chloroflexi bacterium]|nr:hypothetical protein [Chloroflexota bacterium]